MTRAKEIHWVKADHLCRSCGGRVLRSVANVGMTPGGNPLYMCADCGAGGAHMGPDHVCWCGFATKGNNAGSYMCLPFSRLKEEPWLEAAFRECGCDPTRMEVGIMLRASFDRCRKSKEGRQG